MGALRSEMDESSGITWLRLPPLLNNRATQNIQWIGVILQSHARIILRTPALLIPCCNFLKKLPIAFSHMSFKTHNHEARK